MATKTAKELDGDGWEQVAGEEGEPWRPEKTGDLLVGRFEGFDVATDPNGLDGQPRDFKIYKIRTTDGLRSVYSSYKLDKVFLALKAGDDVALTYMGKIDIGSGQKMNDFKVSVKHNS